MRADLILAVLAMLERSHRVISVVIDPAEPRRLIGQLQTGTFFAVHVRLPAEEIAEHAKTYLIRAQKYHGVGCVVGDPGEVDSWLTRLDSARCT